MQPNANATPNESFYTQVSYTGRWKKSLLALGVVTVFLFTVNRLISMTLPLYGTDGNISESAQQMTVIDVLPLSLIHI